MSRLLFNSHPSYCTISKRLIWSTGCLLQSPAVPLGLGMHSQYGSSVSVAWPNDRAEWSPRDPSVSFPKDNPTRAIRCSPLLVHSYTPISPSSLSLSHPHPPIMAPMEKGFSWSNIAVGESSL